MVLNGGDVLFLKTSKTLALWDEKVRQDIVTLGHDEFLKKYDVPMSFELWKDLKEGLQNGEYLPLEKSAERRFTELGRAVSADLGRILAMADVKKKVVLLREIISQIEYKIMEAERVESRLRQGSEHSEA